MKTTWSLGITNLDVITQPVAEWPEKGGLVSTKSTDFKIGDVACNAAVTIAKLSGILVGLIGHVGRDRTGQVVKSGLEALGVITIRLRESRNAPAGVCMVFVHPDGERSFLCSAGRYRTVYSRPW